MKTLTITFLLTFLLTIGTANSDVTPVTDRTQAVQDAIVAAVPNIDAAADVTETHLTAITDLNLRNKGITELKSGDFSGMTALTNLNLYNNLLSKLPEGIFKGLTALTTLRLGSNAVDPMPLIVRIEKNEDEQFKAVISTGAPFDITLPINTTNNGVTSEATTITIPIGNVESALFTVTTANPSGTPIVAIGTLPGLPRNHYGYTFALSTACHRTLQVRRAIVAAVPGVDDCRDVTDAHLAAIQTLNLEYAGISTLRSDDFSGLTSLSTLYLGNNNLTTLPADIFSGLSSLTALYIQNNKLNSLPEDVFSSLSSIRQLNLHSNQLTSLPKNLFSGLPSLTQIFLNDNKLTTLDPDIFSNVSTLKYLYLNNNSLTTLPENLFSDITSLEQLLLNNNRLGNLPPGIFRGMSTPTLLWIHNNSVLTLPLTVSLEKVGEGEFKVVVPTGTPIDIDLKFTVTNGMLNSDSNLLTLTAGNVESDSITVTQTAGSSDAVTVDIEILSELPEYHLGYEPVKSADLPLIVIDKPNVAPVFAGGESITRSVSENTSANVNIGTAITATDADNDTLTYTRGGTDETSFEIDSATGQLKTKVTLDYETKNTYSVTITVSDGSLTDTINVTINVTDIDETIPNRAPVFTEGGSTARIVAENTDAGVNFGAAVAATDPDGNTLAYTIGGTDATAFEIDGATGQLNTKAELDYETKNAYSVTITVSDGSLTDTINVNINVNDANDAPVFTERDATTRTVAENAAAGIHIGTPIIATDADGNILTYTLGGTDVAFFEVDNTIGQLKTKTILDYESQSSYKITVIVSDGSLSDTIDVTINVTDIDETTPNRAPVFTEGGSTTRTVEENTEAGANIGTAIAATDPDGNTLTYTLGGTDAASFVIEVATGQLKTKETLDYETKNSYSITVTVSDGSLTDTIAGTINITDANEAPVFTDGNATTRSVAENLEVGVNIGTAIAATDPDGNTLTYTLGGPDAASFDIDSSTGQLKTKTTLDRESQSTYTVTITVSDSSITNIIVVTINVSNVNEVPVFTEGDSTTRTVAEKTLEGVEIGTAIGATDPDGDTLTYTLSGADADIFELESTTGQLKTKKILDFETQFTYKVTLTVSDGKLSDTIDVTITVIDIDETIPNRAPVFTDGENTTRSVAENTSADENIGTPVEATDADGNTLNYTLGGTDAASFAIEAATGQVKTKSSLDYETKDSYTVTVTVSDGNGGTDSITVTINITDIDESITETTFTGVCDRTPQVRDAIVAAAGVNSCEEVTETHLALISNLSLSTKLITSLKIGDFDGLSSLEYLHLHDNQLTSLPENLFEGLSSLKVLLLAGNQLSSLSEDLFDGLSSLTHLRLINNHLTSLPVDVFDGLSSLDLLELGSNQFTSLPEDIFDGLSSLTHLSLLNNQLTSLSANLFDGLSSLEILPLFGNQLTNIEAGTFEGLSSLDVLFLNINPGETFSFTIALEKVEGSDSDRQFKAVMPTGAPFSVVLPLIVTNGSISGDVTSITIPIGSVESSPLTVTRTSGRTGAVTVDIGTLPSIPRNHTGYSLVKSDNLPLTIITGTTVTNAAPVFTEGTSTSRTVAENTAADTNIGAAVGATDADNNTLTYTLGGTDAATFDIDSTSGQLKTKDTLDYETKNTYSVTITVSDGSLTDTINVTINVTDIVETIPNRAPVFTEGETTTRAVAENTIADTNIGVAVAATDPDNNTLTYTLGGTDAATFDIDSTNGQLKTKDTLNYENKSAYSVTITVSDGDLTDVINVNINVTNQNDAPIFTEGNSATRAVAENTIADTNIGAAVAATDPDGNTLTYTLGGTDAATFDIDSTNGQLKTKDTLNYENKSAYSVTITASDGDLTDVINVNINVTDVNENRAPVFTDGENTTRTVAENTAADTNIGTAVAATDADNDTLTYTLSGTDAASFAIVNTSGQLKTSEALDFETKSSYAVTVSVSDGKGGSDSIGVTISVTDVNENRAPVFTDGENTTRTVAENTAADTNIGTAVIATDADNDTLAYTLSGTNATSFAIVGTSGQLKTSATLDFETKSSYSVMVSVSDGKGGTDSISVTINVTDATENRAPVFTDGENTTRTVAENTAADTNIGIAVAATDADNDTLTYTLSGTDAASFAIVNTSGQLKTSEALDFETKSSYSVTVSVSDGKGGSDSIGVTINVTDATENRAPVFTDGETTTRAVAENTDADTEIGDAVAATDADNDTLTYTLGGNDVASFDIDTTNGQLKTKETLDYETKSSYSVTVSVSDDNSGTDSISVTITVTDIDESTTETTFTSVCDRTPQVRDAIVAAAGVDDCSEVTEAHLTTISSLNIERKSITSLKVGDFDGLSSMELLDLYHNDLSSLSEGIFDELTALTDLRLCVNDLSSLPEGIFDELTALTDLRLNGNDLNSLPEGIFDELTALTQLEMGASDLSSLPEGIFDELTALTFLQLGANDLSSLPEGIFDELTALQTLYLYSNDLRSLPDDIFDENIALRNLSLGDNDLSSLPEGIFDELTALQTLSLGANDLRSLPDGIFDELTALTHLSLSHNDLSSLQADIFDELTALEHLLFSDNGINSFSEGIFDELTALTHLTLSYNDLSSLPEGIFNKLTALTKLNLGSNTVDPLLLTVSLDKVSDGQFKAVAPTGAPFDFVLPLTVANGSISGSATSVTISTGKVESDTLTVTRTAGTTGAVTVDIGTLPSIPSSHRGYALAKPTTGLPLEVIAAVGGAPTSVSNNAPQVPEVTAVMPNYPNPFNPETWIPYQLAKSADVSLTFYNIHGVVVRRLVLGHRAAGVYYSRSRAAHWDGRNNIGEKVATGTYFCTFTAGDFITTRKMVIRK